MDKDVEMKMVDKAANDLGEHFDSVQIFCTRHASGEEDGTVNISIGVGNWFARYGHVKDWLIKAEERTRRGVQVEES